MRDQAQEGGGHGVAEGREGFGTHQVARDHLPGGFGEPLLVGHQVPAVLHQTGVEVHAAARVAHDDLGGVAHLQAVLVGHLAERPLGRHQLVGRVLDGHRQELDLLLHHLRVAVDDVAHLGVAVLDHPAHLADDLHGLAAHQAPLREGMAFVVALLLGDGVDLVELGEEVVLQLPESLQRAAGACLQLLLGLAEDVLRGTLQRIAFVVVEGADQVEGRHFREGVHEGRAVAGHHVEIAGVRIHEGEQARTVHPLAHGKDLVQMSAAVDDEIELLQAAIPGHIAEVQHPDVVGFDEPDDVLLGEVLGGLPEGADQLVGIQADVILT
ncbi:MAG: hypothetical protein BWY56_02538 [Acidobacteria bacterium ADurb.Bin340]|nr:MAG: hypothetical protein BWY56_02538 [Acidobacteria bacterium ADurb.Bin340]